MQHSPLSSRWLVAVATAALVVLLGAYGRAGAQAGKTQTNGVPPAPAQTWLRIDTVQVKPEMWTEYRTLERDEVIPALRKAGVRSRAAWTTAEFGSTYELVLVRPVSNFAEYDSGDSFSRALGPRESERLRERLRRCLLSRDSAAVVQRSDLSVGETGRPFVVVTTLTVAPGRGPEYEDFLRDTLPEVRKAGIVFGVYQRIYGQQTAWLLVQNLDSLGELALAPSGFFRAFGEENAERRLSKLSGIVTSVERKVFRFDPELSFSFPGAAESEKRP
jgi:hypothetical protein